MTIEWTHLLTDEEIDEHNNLQPIEEILSPEAEIIAQSKDIADFDEIDWFVIRENPPQTTGFQPLVDRRVCPWL